MSVRLLQTLCISVALGSLSLPAHAQSGAMHRATAEALFQQGVELAQEKKYAQACKKFEGSLEMDYALGTLLRLSDCYDRLGRSASAWGSFEELRALAEKAGDERRLHIATLRAQELQQRLSRVRLQLEPPLPEGVQIRLGASSVPTATLGQALPVDPGSVRLQVSAPGYETWSQSLRIEPGPSLQELKVPTLSPVSTPPRAASPRTDAESVDQFSVLTYVLGATGLAALTASAYFAFDAYSDNRSSLAYCRPDDADLCSAEGIDLRQSAIRSANWSTITLAVGGAAALGTLGLVVWGSDGSSPEQDVRVTASASPWGANCQLEGSF